jgi:hypothetical protein
MAAMEEEFSATIGLFDIPVYLWIMLDEDENVQ